MVLKIDGSTGELLAPGSGTRAGFQLHIVVDFDAVLIEDNSAPIPKEAGDNLLKGAGKYIYSKEYVFKGGHHSAGLQIVPYEKMRELMVTGTVPKVSAKGKSSHHKNFILAYKGEEKTRSLFSVAGSLSQMFTLGCMV